MRYRVAFQYRPKDRDRPEDHTQSFDVTGGHDEFLMIPNIGDHVFLPDEDGEKGDNGVVENRSFFYERTGGEVWCLVNIVLTDSDVPGGKLMKS
jgi:hypothetical protein